MVEFVFVAPLLIMLVFAIIFFGLALNIKQDLTRAAAEGARAGAVVLPRADAVTSAQSACDEALVRFFGGADTTCLVSGIDINGNPVAAGDPTIHAVEVVVTYSGDLAGNTIPFVGQVVPDTLSSKSVARTN